MQRTIVFDVNETLLDLSPIRRWFTNRFDDEPDASMWFGELLRLSFISASTNRYVPFPKLGEAALTTAAERCGSSIGDGDINYIGGLFTTLPAHPEVAEGLTTLRSAGFFIAALTNSPQDTAETQIMNAGISHLFDAIMSVEMVDRFKPHPSVYQAAAAKLGVRMSQMVMVAAHDWDIVGAMTAGCDGVFVTRPGQIYSPSFNEPTLTATDIADAARRIITHYT